MGARRQRGMTGTEFLMAIWVGVLLVVALGYLCKDFIPYRKILNHQGLAAWVQAAGATVALGLTVWVVHHQAQLQRNDRRGVLLALLGQLSTLSLELQAAFHSGKPQNVQLAMASLTGCLRSCEGLQIDRLRYSEVRFWLSMHGFAAQLQSVGTELLASASPDFALATKVTAEIHRKLADHAIELSKTAEP